MLDTGAALYLVILHGNVAVQCRVPRCALESQVPSPSRTWHCNWCVTAEFRKKRTRLQDRCHAHLAGEGDVHTPGLTCGYLYSATDDKCVRRA